MQRESSRVLRFYITLQYIFKIGFLKIYENSIAGNGDVSIWVKNSRGTIYPNKQSNKIKSF